MNQHAKIFIVAGFFYLFIAPFFFHPDIKVITYLAQFLSQGVFNIYDFVATHPDRSFLGPFVYPPLAYFVWGMIFPVINYLGGADFSAWLAMGNDAVGVPHLLRYLFLLKLPLIGAHLLAGNLLVRQVADIKKRRIILLFWFFNPVAIYTVGLMGQIDVLPVLTTVLALVWFRKHSLLSAVMLGLGAATKTYPLLLLPFAALLGATSLRKSLAILAAGALAYLALVLPFLTTPAFWQDTLTSGLTQRIFQLGLPLGFGENVLLVPAYLMFLVYLAWYRHRGRADRLAFYGLAVTLVPVVFSHFHPQWLLWSMPFLALVVVKLRQFFPVGLLFAGYLGTVGLFTDKFLTWGLVSPLNPEMLFLPPLAQVLAQAPLVQNLFHTLLVVSSVWLVWQGWDVSFKND